MLVNTEVEIIDGMQITTKLFSDGTSTQSQAINLEPSSVLLNMTKFYEKATDSTVFDEYRIKINGKRIHKQYAKPGNI